MPFLKDVLDHVQITDMNPHERTKQFGIAFSYIAEAMKITNPISDFDKKEIKELVLKRFKRLSINEIYYAFKLERFVELGDPIKHYNRFDAQYVAQVLDKYVQWKINVRQKHNLDIAKEQTKKTATEMEKRFWINHGVTECLEYFLEHRKIMDGKSYIYEVLYEHGYLPTDIAYKKRVHKDALEAIRYECENTKAKSLLERRAISETLNEIRKKGSPKVKIRCHMIALREFFQKLTKDEKKLSEFRKNFKNG